MKYRAFISYSQKDKIWAEKIHKALEAYRVPAGVVASIDKDTRKIGRIFRDNDEMEASQSLGDALEEALKTSETLVVLCSPNSAKSEWVDREVRRFKQLANGRVFALIVDGTPNAEVNEEECFCPCLRFKVTDTGELTDIPDEPLAPDLRKESFERIKARLISGILSINFDDLWQREKRRKKKQGVRYGLITTLLISVMIFLSVSLIRTQNATQSKDLLVFAQSALEAQGTPALEPDRGATAERALRFSVLAGKSDFLTPRTKDTEESIYAALGASRAVGLYALHDAPVKFGRFVEGAELAITAADDNSIALWRYQSGEIVDEIITKGLVSDISRDGRVILSQSNDGAFHLYEIKGEDILLLSSLEGQVGQCASLSPDGSRLAYCTPAGAVKVIDIATGVLLQTITDHYDNTYKVAFSEDSKLLLTVGRKEAGFGTFLADFEAYSQPELWDIETGTQIAIQPKNVSDTGEPRQISVGARLVTFRGDKHHRFFLFHDGSYAFIGVDLENAPMRSLELALPRQNYGVSVGYDNLDTIANNLPTETGAISAAHFYGRGDYITANTDHVIRAWYVNHAAVTFNANQPEMMRLEGHEESIHFVRISPDFNFMMSGAENGHVRLWDVSDLSERRYLGEQRGNALLKSVCHQTTGYLRGDLSLITAGDVIAAPQLSNRVGEDVCDGWR